MRLWNSGVCPFAQRVWIALLELETPFTHQIIDLADKPSEFLRLSELASGSKDKSTVPLLETGTGEVVSESLDIVRLLGRAARSKGPGSRANGNGSASTYAPIG